MTIIFNKPTIKINRTIRVYEHKHEHSQTESFDYINLKSSCKISVFLLVCKVIFEIYYYIYCLICVHIISVAGMF